MELAFLLYTVGLVSALGSFFWGTFVVSILAIILFSGCFLGFKSDGHDSVADQMAKYLKYSLIACALSSFVAVFLPNEKTMWMMLAAYGVTEVSQNDQVQEIVPKSLTLLESHIDNRLEELLGTEEE